MEALHDFLRKNPDYKTDILNILDALDEEFIFETASPKHALGHFMQFLIKLHGIQDQKIIDHAIHIFLAPHHHCDKHKNHKIPKTIRHLFFVYLSAEKPKNLWDNIKIIGKILRFYFTGLYKTRPPQTAY